MPRLPARRPMVATSRSNEQTCPSGRTAGVPWRPRLTGPIVVEAALVLGLWAVLLVAIPRWFVTGYLVGYAGGLALCWLHGHYEHARGMVSRRAGRYVGDAP